MPTPLGCRIPAIQMDALRLRLECYREALEQIAQPHEGAGADHSAQCAEHRRIAIAALA